MSHSFWLLMFAVAVQAVTGSKLVDIVGMWQCVKLLVLALALDVFKAYRWFARGDQEARCRS